MDKNQYELEKQRIIEALGSPIKGNGFESSDNECQRQLNQLKGKYLADVRAEQKKRKEDIKGYSHVSVSSQVSIPEAKEIKQTLDNLSGLVPLDSDLTGFKGVEKEILRIYLVNQDISPKKLANSFGVSYQSIAGLLNSKAVMLLRAKYFHKQLDNNTKIGLLKLTEDADPKIVLASAEFLKILHEKEKDDDSVSKIVDPRADKALMLLGDWLAGSMHDDFRIKSSDLD